MCGIFGVVGHPEASNLTYLGLYANQHRGQESAGIVSTDGQKVFRMRRRCLVSEAFDKDAIAYLKGSMAIGHVRYSTTGESVQRNVQPFMGTTHYGDLSLAHNGNLTNFRPLKEYLQRQGAVFQSTMDTEVMLHLIARSESADLSTAVIDALNQVEGAFSLLCMSKDVLVAVRDPWGFRPLSIGKLTQGGWAISSETCAFDLIEADFVRDLDPGEVVVFHANGSLSTFHLRKVMRAAPCVFEQIYFARPDSIINQRSIYSVRKALGNELAREHPIEADIVTPVPDSGTFAALGFSEQSGIPMEMGFIRNHYVGRTFIEPAQSIRGFGVRIKLNPVSDVVAGKTVAVVDDSIVRGTTSKKILKMLRDAGAKKIILLISSPPFNYSCFYGIDTPNRSELIASQMNTDEICQYIGADELHFLTLDGVLRAVKGTRQTFCHACFSGDYPTKIDPFFLPSA